MNTPPHRNCCVDGCCRKLYAKGYCLMHYKRVKKSGNAGSPESTRPIAIDYAVRPVLEYKNTKLISLNKGYSAIVDDDDFDELSKFNWSCLETGGLVYARRTVTNNGKQKTLLLHRLIAGAKDHETVDHINGNGLDCRRSNMRIVTQAQNCINRIGSRSSKTGIKGVRKHTLCNKYQAEITSGKRIYLGLFPTAEAAAKAYEEASIIYHGEFRRIT